MVNVMPERKTVQSVQRACRIVEIVARSDAGVSLGELSQALGLQPNTTYYLADTLVGMRFLDRVEHPRRYRLGPALSELLALYRARERHQRLIAAIRGVPQGISLPSPPTHQTKYSIEEAVAKMIQSMSMAWGFRVPVYPKISATSTALAVLNNLTRNPYASALAIDGEDGGTGAAYHVSMNSMGHPIASNIRDAYLTLVKLGKQNEIPLFAGGGIGKNGNLAANAAALIMLGASGVQVGKVLMQAAAGCVGSETDRCNICNIGLCPKGITSQDPRLYRRLDPEKVAERLVDVFVSFDTELKKIVAPLGRSTSLPIGMSDALGIADNHAARRLGISYVI